MKRTVFIGFDPRETAGFAVTRHSARRHGIAPVPTFGLRLAELRAAGLYHRPTSIRDGRLWDDISEAPMSTEFAISRFLVPHLAGGGWALFMDCDMLVRTNLDRLFDQADPDKAVMVVKHDHRPANDIKMDGQLQTAYARKNWSSVMLINCGHKANRALTPALVNAVAGRDLHRFCWLDDSEIGGLDPKWNFLVGHSDPRIDPAIVHFTDGTPDMPGYEAAPWAEEWRAELMRWAA
jgi:hypothetical protein